MTDNVGETARGPGGKGQSPECGFTRGAPRTAHQELSVIGGNVASVRIGKRSRNGRGFAASRGSLNNSTRVGEFIYVEPGAIGDQVVLRDTIARELGGVQDSGWRRRRT